jgi:hypothetical protein
VNRFRNPMSAGGRRVDAVSIFPLPLQGHDPLSSCGRRIHPGAWRRLKIGFRNR